MEIRELIKKITEIKISLDELDNRMNRQRNELVTEMQSNKKSSNLKTEKQKLNKKNRNEERIRDLWDNSKRSNCLTKVPSESQKERFKSKFKSVQRSIDRTFLKLDKRNINININIQ